MTSSYDADLLEIASRHLGLVQNYNPYANFPGVKDRKGFIAKLKEDPAFRYVGFANDKYVIARIGGNLITSLHRKLGDMYQEMFGYLLHATFGVPSIDLLYSVNVDIGDLQQKRSTDGLLRSARFGKLELKSLPDGWRKAEGIGFEVRSCYQIGDSKRIQADWHMALALQQKNIVPVMLIFCQTSLKSPVARLRKSWNIFEGHETFAFIEELTGYDLDDFLKRHESQMGEAVEAVFANL